MLFKVAEFIINKHLSKKTIEVSFDKDYKVITIPIVIVDNKIPELPNTDHIEKAIHEASAHKESIFYRLNFLVNGIRMSEYEFAHYAACKTGYVDFAIKVSEVFWKNRTKEDLLNDCFTPITFELLFAPIRKNESDTLARENDQAKLAMQIIKLSKDADWGHIGTSQSHILGFELMHYKIPQNIKDQYYYDLTRFGNDHYFHCITPYKNVYKWGNLWLDNLNNDICCIKCAINDGEQFYDKYSNFIGFSRKEWINEITRICAQKEIETDCEESIDDEEE